MLLKRPTPTPQPIEPETTTLASLTQKTKMKLIVWMIVSLLLLLSLSAFETAQAAEPGEMNIIFGYQNNPQFLAPPFSFTMGNLDTEENSSNRPMIVRTTGSLPATNGSIKVNVVASNLRRNWNVDSSHNVTISKLATYVHSWGEGWGVDDGSIGQAQLLVLNFNVDNFKLPANTGLMISAFNVSTKDGETVNPRYIVEGRSNTKLGRRGSYKVNTSLHSNVRIAFTDGPYRLYSLTLKTFPIVVDPPVTKTIRGSRPNVIFYVGDDQSIFDYRTYGNPQAPTPITSAFANESLVFDQAYTGQTVCAPSRSMLYTGLYPVRNGCFMNNYIIRPDVKTLPTHLQELGYKVVLAGKSHVRPDEQFPWDEQWESITVEGKPRKGLQFDEIEKFLADPGPDPFCLVVASAYPHGPYISDTPYKPEDVKLPPWVAEEDRSHYARYYASIAEKEAEFAKVLQIVDDNGLKNDTVVMYTDDHGSEKFFTYDRGLNVALMVRWPDKIKPGRTSKLVSFADYVPTMIDLAGGQVPSSLDGKSMVPIWEGADTVLHDHVYGVAHKQGVRHGRGVYPQRSVYDGRYHYIYNFNSQERIEREEINNYFYKRGAQLLDVYDEELLFDLETDPYELTNIADETGSEEIKARLRLQLFKWMSEQNDFLEENEPAPFLQLWDAYRLDFEDESVDYFLPEKRIGALKGRMVHPHRISEPLNSD